jgi:hypothetical protein
MRRILSWGLITEGVNLELRIAQMGAKLTF